VTSEPFHDGEIAVQTRAGVRTMAEKVSHGIHPDIPLVVQAFLREQRMVVVASADRRGAVWASLLCGRRGFARAVDELTMRVDAAPAAGDPLADTLRPGAGLGLLAIDFATRHRMRVNGVVESVAERGFVLRAEQVFGNCPKYIQRRELPDNAIPASRGRLISDAAQLSPAQRAWIESADTFVIASLHPERGADASHRGGNPGFVRFIDGDTIVWPDYAGNMMFQTLGNLTVNPAAGLLFLDFSAGSTLQLTGTAKIVWDFKEQPAFAGAERLVELHLERAIEIADNCPANWQFLEPSPFNPR